MSRRISFLFVGLVLAGFFIVRGAFSQAPASPTRQAITLPGRPSPAPLSDGMLVGNTLYLSGRLGLDPKTGKPPVAVEDEIKMMLDGFKPVLTQAGMTMDDLAYVQVFCSDLTLFDKFNPIYKSYFTTKDLPVRAFIGAGSLLRGAHFEMQAIAVKR